MDSVDCVKLGDFQGLNVQVISWPFACVAKRKSEHWKNVVCCKGTAVE